MQLGDESILYDPVTCLLVSLPLPLRAHVIEASPKRPFLAVVLGIDLSVGSQINAKLRETLPTAPPQSALQKMVVSGTLLDSLPRRVRGLPTARRLRP